jgi:hypothetical protein
VKEIDEFFARYEEGANNFDADLLASQYTDCFIAAGPKGTACVSNDAKWKEAAAERKRLFQSLGFRFARILRKQVTRIDDTYAMVEVHWHLRFDNPSARQADFRFSNTYFVGTADGVPKVCFYISHEDEEDVMKEAGLVPMETT